MHHMKTPHPQQSIFQDEKAVRVTVPVSPRVLESFKRMAAASGMSTGKAMGEWLGDTLEAAEAVTEALERARERPKQVIREMHSYALGLVDTTREVIDGMGRAAGRDGHAERAGRPAAAPLPPRTVIRGGKSQKSQPSSGRKP